MSWLNGLLLALFGSMGLFWLGKKNGKDEVKKEFEVKLKEEELVNEFKKTDIVREVADSSLDDLVSANNAKYGNSKPK